MNQRDRGGRLNAGGFALGFPHRRMGTPSSAGDSSTNSNSTPVFTVRWESALPVQAAELKARNTNAPAVDENHYTIAVYGVPTRMINFDSAQLDGQLKDQAAIKRTGKKDLRPSSVEVLPRDDTTVVVYFFPRSKKISLQDEEVEFNAQIGRFELSQSFKPAEMTYQGKLEL